MESEFLGDSEAFMARNVILFNYSAGFRQRCPNTCAGMNGKIAENNFNAAIKAVMVANKSGLKFSLRLQENTSDDGKSIYFLAPELGDLPSEPLNALFANGNIPLENAQELIVMMKNETDQSSRKLH